MMSRASCLAAALRAAILSLLIAVPSGSAAEDDEPPIVGQPPHFNGAVGRFTVTADAAPKTLQAEDALTYTVRVTATAAVKLPPQRPALAEFPGFSADFYIEEIGPPEGTHPDDKTWEFAYRLKPKSTDVQMVPGFPFVFFRPGLLPPSRGYMTTRAPEVPITVTPRAAMPERHDEPAASRPRRGVRPGRGRPAAPRRRRSLAGLAAAGAHAPGPAGGLRGLVFRLASPPSGCSPADPPAPQPGRPRGPSLASPHRSPPRPR